MAQLEAAGVATIVFCTTPFIPAAKEQWEALGYKVGSWVPVGHPLGSMPVEQAIAEADKALEKVIGHLLGGGGPNASA
jgi:deoxyribose-phosphate aldolase